MWTHNDERRGGRRSLTEHGAATISEVLHGEKSIQVRVAITRAFVKLPELISNNREFAQKPRELEMRLEKHDEEIETIFRAVAKPMAPPPEKHNRPIGFSRE